LNEFSVDVRRDGDRCVLVVRGDIDVEHAPDLHTIGLHAISSSAGTMPLVVDLSSVLFMDSTGLGALVAIRNAAQASGSEVLLRGPSSRVLRILEITGMDSVFPIDGPVEDTVES
jgi:anti-sigma B factor antagonist